MDLGEKYWPCKKPTSKMKLNWPVYYLTPGISLLSSTFRLWCWIGEGKNNWFLQDIKLKEKETISLLSHMLTTQTGWTIERSFSYPRRASLSYLIEGCHSLYNFFSKRSPSSRRSNQDCRLNWLAQNENCEGGRVGWGLWRRGGENRQTFTAFTSSFTGSWSCAQGLLKCWSISIRDLTISP